MLEVFKSNGWNDFRQRYSNTYGWYNHEGKKVMVHVDEVFEDEVHFSDKNGVKYNAIADKGVTFEFLPVQRGVYNYVNDDLLYVSRKPARMWKRGIAMDNTNFYSFRKGAVRPDFSMLETVFGTPATNPITDWVKGKRNNVALSPQFSVYDNKVFLYDQKIGVYKTGVITLDTNLFSQEITDLIRKNDLAYTVEVANG
jgi:hypothetical protein